MKTISPKLQDILWFGVLLFTCTVVFGAASLAFQNVDSAYFGVFVDAPLAKALVGAAVTAGGAMAFRLGWRGIKRMFLEPVQLLMPQLRELAHELRTELREMRNDMRADREQVHDRLDHHERRMNRFDDELYEMRKTK